MRAASVFSSLTNRIFLGAALLVVLSIAAAVYRVNLTVGTQAEGELRRELAQAGAVVDEYRTTLFAHFLREARLLADLPRLKAAVATGDAPTVQSPADEYRAQLESDVLIVTGPDGRVLAASGTAPAALDADARAAIGAARAGEERAWFWPQAAGVLQMASLPIWIDPGAPELLGTLSVGFRLDRQTAARFRALTNTEVAFAHRGRVLASTIDAGHAGALEHALRSGADGIRLDGEDYLLLARPLHHASAAGPIEDAPLAVLLRSRADLEQLLGRVLADLAGSALIAVLAATLLAYGIARTVTGPLRALSATMREMAATGDLTRRAPARGPWDDEDARLLGATFDSLTSSIARFQREASEREKLSSLGRLSTVIAHEVRNPLMIIKSALHALEDPRATQTDVRAAAEDIEGEVARLNRIVTDVLDFARPIAFELSGADVNEVSAEAAKAVASGGAAIRLSLHPRLPAIVTDAERLRQTIINVLANAQEASGPAGTVTLTTAPLDGGARIAIRDDGPGIAPDALPRVFDPYFTTKRTGTGIGLAIARNIVEGLGGRITAESEPGAGTCITIALPPVAPGRER